MSKYAGLLNSITEAFGPTANGREYALDLDEGGPDVDVYFHGAATQWPRQLAEKPNHPVNKFFETADDRVHAVAVAAAGAVLPESGLRL